MLKVSIIIPTYNEVDNLEILVNEIFSSLNQEIIDAEIIIVDDNSPDGTGEFAEKLSRNLAIKVIHRSGKMGLGSAVIAGFNLSDRDYLGVMDGDLSHDPAILNKLIQSLNENDIAIGSRFSKGSEVEGWNFFRKILSLTGVGLGRLLAGNYDILSGYFFIKRDVIKDISLNTKGYKILFEILMRGNHQSVSEHSFTFRKRKNSTSKLNSEEYWLFLKQLFLFGLLKIKSKCLPQKK